MKTHTGDTGWSCDWCGKVLASRVMSELHQKSCALVPGVQERLYNQAGISGTPQS